MKLFLVCLVACSHPAPPPVANDEAEATDDDPEDPNDQLPAVTATRGGLLAEAQRELAAMKSSHYEHHTHVDEAIGLFDFDCSGFVGYALEHVAPDALHAVVEATHKSRPLAKHFEAAFEAPPAPWIAVPRVDAIQPGDVIAWLEPADIHSRNTGHVMIVETASHPDARRDELVVGVIDSSHSWHGKGDSRHAERVNGLGRGDLVLLVGDDGRANGFRWSTSKKSLAHHTSVAIARLK